MGSFLSIERAAVGAENSLNGLPLAGGYGVDISGIQKNSVTDFPGRVSAVLYFSGCNYACMSCKHEHNQVKRPPLAYGKIMSYLQRRKGLLEGIVLSGGEPLVQPGVIEFARETKRMGYEIKLDTNGSQPEVLEKMLEEGLIDYVTLDYKAPFFMYNEICGAEAWGVAKTLKLLLAYEVEFEMRTTMIPQITPERLGQMAREIPEVPRYVLEAYHPGDMETLHQMGDSLYAPAQLHQLAESVKKSQPGVTVRL